MTAAETRFKNLFTRVIHAPTIAVVSRLNAAVDSHFKRLIAELKKIN